MLLGPDTLKLYWSSTNCIPYSGYSSSSSGLGAQNGEKGELNSAIVVLYHKGFRCYKNSILKVAEVSATEDFGEQTSSGKSMPLAVSN